ncbi:WXG100 family type VII secretion target [Amycolatopsis keratiniphila]|uniref:ESAT-6-like protein n=1 Tax=Amycolatopsis keratiniphila subsp. keratiniphila TaxID=227715 RepID=A0A1W2LGP7_9PSEU|nr:WXG100 family type VII secretion target [Amycolatopsis keratiniphila]ONF62037.1 type VII secretion protein [Amycolatopsis keratiniphila subsp. keratiniphila]
MAGGFTGTVEQFTEAEKRVTEVRVSMDQNLSKLRDNIESTRAGWTGDASIAFNNVMKRFDEAGRGLNQALQNIGDLLEQAGSKYNATEQQQQELIKSVNQGFGVLG